MKFSPSIRARLVALTALALVGIGALAALAAGSNQVNQRALEGLYERDIDALTRMQRVENSLLEVRFRAAAVLLEQMPVPGSLNHLRETRKAVGEQWAALDQHAGVTFADGEAQKAYSQLREQWKLVDATLAKLERGYVAKDKAVLTEVLEEDWAVLHKGAVKPLQALIPLTQARSAASYQAATATSRTLLGAGVATGLACLLGIGIASWLTLRSLLRPLREVEHSMRRIAEGDLAAALPAPRRDELGSMIVALGTMQQRLSHLVGTVRETAESVRLASGEVAVGNDDLSARTEQAASQLQQTASSMEQLTGTVGASASAARHASTLALSAAQVAAEGRGVVSQVQATMNDIDQSSKKIASIIGVIDGIAFQTNILALNAAVEAARAGEQGRGFAVVAGEVRSLAGRSAEAARQIKTLIGSSVERVESGSRLVAGAGAVMDRISAAVHEVSDRIGDVTASAAQQSEGIAGVNTAVSQLDQMTQQNAALVEQSAAAAQSLRDQAERLKSAIDAFSVDAFAAAAAH